MRQEAESHADDDRKRRDLVEARNAADNAVYSAEKALREAGDRIQAPVRTNVETRIQTVREKLDSQDATALRQATQDLMEAMQAIGAAMYEGPSVGGSGEAPSGPGGGEGPEDVVDGEFKEA